MNIEIGGLKNRWVLLFSLLFSNSFAITGNVIVNKEFIKDIKSL